MTYDGQGRSPFYLTPAGTAEAQAALAKVTGPGQSLGIGGTAYVHGNFWVAGQFAQDFTPNSKGAPNLQYSETQNLALGRRSSVPSSPPDDVWRNWWAIEKINRDLQKPRTPDRVVPAGNAAH
jgi:hypothetical protein